MSVDAASIRPPARPPETLYAENPQGNAFIRLTHDPALGPPLMAGLVPASVLGTTEVIHKARYAQWKGVRHDDLTCTLEVDVTWEDAPDGIWLVFLLYDQPYELGPNWLEHRTGDETFQPLPSATARWCSEHSQLRIRPGDMQASLRRVEHEALIGPRSTQIVLPPVNGITHARPVPPPFLFSPEAIAALRSASPQNETLSVEPLSILEDEDASPVPPSRLLVASCQYPAGMLDRTPMRAATHSPSERTLSAVLWLHRNEAPIDLMIRLGDQVYVDATAGLADPQLRDGGVGQAYRKWMEAPVASRVVSDIRQAPMLDDHEMCDNWSPVSPQSPSCLEDGRPADAKAYMDQLRDEGVQAFRTHQMTLGAGSDHATLYGICGTDALGRSVFMADTRSGRECRNMGNVGQAVIMPDAQAEAIEAWLHTSAGRGAWHFLASPSMVLPRLRRVAHAPTAAGALLSDAWDGFPASLHRLLWHIHATRTQRLVLLSGDAHLAHILRITLQEHTLDPQTETWRAHGDQTIVHGLHAPAMYSPFPFANARPADYSPDDFDIPHSDDPSRRLHCGLQTWFPTFGEGCFLLDIPHDASQALGVTLIHTGSTATMSPCPAWLTESRDLHVAVKTMTAIAPSS